MEFFQNGDIRIGVISNIVFEPHFTPLVKLFFGENTKVYPIPYGEYNEGQYIKQIADADLILTWLNFETLFPNARNSIFSKNKTEEQVVDDVVCLCSKLYLDIKANSSANILWFLFEDYFQQFVISGHRYDPLIDKINITLTNAFTDNVTFINLKRLIADVGIAASYDHKGKYRWNAPYSKVLIEAAVKEIYKQYLIEKGITKKCLVLDCDNVLWGGILSEDGIENLKLGNSGLGRAYQDFQRFVLSLYYHGVILAVCSKNDLSDVLIMFREHSEMILKEEHIACLQVNWENKPMNIKQVSETLNIGLDRIVFIDDSQVEVEAVKSILPEVTAIIYERDSIYEKLSCFNLKNNVNAADIEKRNETYRTNQSREILKSQYESYDEYITALEVKIDIHEALSVEFSRISELTQRTNKCTNGKRYTVVEIKERIASENIKLYSISVSDRFSDLGLVGALEIEDNVLTLFSISCRSLGRQIEEKLLDFLVNRYAIKKIEFKSTGKNEDVKTLLLSIFPNVIFI